MRIKNTSVTGRLTVRDGGILIVKNIYFSVTVWERNI